MRVVSRDTRCGAALKHGVTLPVVSRETLEAPSALGRNDPCHAGRSRSKSRGRGLAKRGRPLVPLRQRPRRRPILRHSTPALAASFSMGPGRARSSPDGLPLTPTLRRGRRCSPPWWKPRRPTRRAAPRRVCPSLCPMHPKRRSCTLRDAILRAVVRRRRGRRSPHARDATLCTSPTRLRAVRDAAPRLPGRQPAKSPS